MSLLQSASRGYLDGANVRTGFRLLIAEDESESARDLLLACVVVGGLYLLGFLVPGLVSFLEQQPVFIQFLVGLSSAVLAFRGMGLVPVAFVQYLLLSALIAHGAFQATALGTGGPAAVPVAIVSLVGYIFFLLLMVFLIGLPLVPGPTAAGFVFGRLGRVANARYGPSLAALRDEDGD